jgi:hypothetical protein
MIPKHGHHAAKAKRVIYLHMSGAPPHLDLFDYKPELVKRSGQDCPDSILKGRRFAFHHGRAEADGHAAHVCAHGKAGMWMSDACPNFHTIADEMCMIRSMNTDQFNHAPAELLLFTGHARQGRPSMGSWATYGLGTENQDLPGFVSLISSGTQPSGGQGCWGSGFIPSVYQGVQCRSKGDPVLFVSDPAGMNREMRRKTLDTLQALNQQQVAEFGHPETVTRIAQYELAFRMQTSVPEVMDISKEPQNVIEAYGAKPGEVELCQQLPARASSHRKRRALCESLRLGLGLPRHRAGQWHRGRPHEENGRHGQAGGRFDQRPQATRPAGRHARHLGR